jgi:hypothetical protein
LQYAGSVFPGFAAVDLDEVRLRGDPEEVVAELSRIGASRPQAEWRAAARAAFNEAGGVSLRDGSELVFRRVWRARHNAPATLPVNAPTVILDEGEIGWCDQCDQKVSGQRAARCTDKHCSMRRAEAA